MAASLNPVNLLQRWSGASNNVVQAIKNASARTGVSFEYMMNKAKQESSFDPSAKAGSSSATGLFQFIDSTWLQAVKTYGDQFGLGDVADKISTGGKVSDAATKQEILKLRENPEVAANITAAMTKDNASYLQNSLGGKVGQNELYMAHFMGLGGADKFLKARQENAVQPAADLFPAAAGANKNVFYDASGRKKSLDEVYNFFAAKMGSTEGDQPVTLVAASRPMNKYSTSTMIKPSGQGFTMPVDLSGQADTAQAVSWGERQMLEALLSGVNNFGGNTEGSGKRADSSLLSSYTSFVLAKLQSPDDATRKDETRSGL
ncbi:MAG: hypothetical protein JWM96_709 [Alphaproteobacteria bacterium]|nr:hypothetical protein [Alphaproteobacteria bacterium]